MRNVHQRRATIIKELVEKLLAQKETHDDLVEILNARIENLEYDLSISRDKAFGTYLFFTDEHTELIPEFVEMIYEKKDVHSLPAKEIVRSFHDETLDLSTLKCTGNDFEPWKREDD